MSRRWIYPPSSQARSPPLAEDEAPVLIEARADRPLADRSVIAVHRLSALALGVKAHVHVGIGDDLAGIHVTRPVAAAERPAAIERLHIRQTHRAVGQGGVGVRQGQGALAGCERMFGAADLLFEGGAVRGQAAAVSTAITLVLAVAATFSALADRLVGVLTELALGLPHFVLILMVVYAAGGGMTGVILGVALTHRPRLSRVLRHEAQTVAAADYVRISRALGRSRIWIARHHTAPHVLSQLVAGFVLIFPHAILHEAGLSFIGLGIEPHLPSIGVMLADSLHGLMAGHWWVPLFPGLGLVLLALAFEAFGEILRRAADPREGVA